MSNGAHCRQQVGTWNGRVDLAAARCNDAATDRAIRFVLLSPPITAMGGEADDMREGAFVQCMRGAGYAAAYSNAEADQLKARYAP